jgi:hypothetical protein
MGEEIIRTQGTRYPQLSLRRIFEHCNLFFKGGTEADELRIPAQLGCEGKPNQLELLVIFFCRFPCGGLVLLRGYGFGDRLSRKLSGSHRLESAMHLSH